MKKYILYVFIILVGLAGILSPVTQVHATPYSDCIAFESTIGESDPRSCDGLPGDPKGVTTVACVALDGISKVICQVNHILNSVIPVIVALGVLYFVWGVVHYVIGGGDEAKKKGRDHIIYGLIGLAVITGLWGLVNILPRTFGLSAGAPQVSVLGAAGGSTCTLAGNPKFQDLLCYITRIINDSIIPLIFTLAVLIFVWGVVQYVINSSEEAKKEKGRQFMLWGIIALAVMVSVWGLVGILTATFGIDGSVIPQVKP